MKRAIIILNIIFVLFSCEKEELSGALVADFEAVEKGERVFFINKSSKEATYYQLTIPSGAGIYYGDLKDTLGSYNFPGNGIFDVELLVKNKKGESATIIKKVKVTALGVGMVPIDSTLLVKPEINISYTILDSGYVQFHLLSPDNNRYSWYTAFGTISYTANHKIWFRNGLNEIGFGTQNKFGLNADTTLFINISNSIPQIDSKRFVKGIVFGDSIDVNYDIDIQNVFLGGGIPSYDSLTPVAYIWPEYKINYFSIADLNTVRGTSIQKMREQFKIGSISLAQFDLTKGTQLSPGWQVFLYGKFESGGRITISGKYKQQESLDILSVKEIYQAPVFPELEPTAFIVTFRYKATTYGQILGDWLNDKPHIQGKDIIDLTFDVKYNVYPKRVKT
jgi:hypothetical protein